MNKRLNYHATTLTNNSLKKLKTLIYFIIKNITIINNNPYI